MFSRGGGGGVEGRSWWHFDLFLRKEILWSTGVCGDKKYQNDHYFVLMENDNVATHKR